MRAGYDQPVIIRLNTKDEFELRGGFPKTAEELFKYQAVIVGDLEADFFTHEQQALLQRFVSERGGGFLMLGGAESFREGNYAGTPIASMLPVYLDRATEATLPAMLKLNLTREGWLQPWTRLRATEGDEKSRLEPMPPFEVLNPTHDIKPGASILATVSDPTDKTYPALVAQRFGLGRTAALMIGDLWLWGLRDEAMQKDLDKSLASTRPLAGVGCAAEHFRGRRTFRERRSNRSSIDRESARCGLFAIGQLNGAFDGSSGQAAVIAIRKNSWQSGGHKLRPAYGGTVHHQSGNL